MKKIALVCIILVFAGCKSVDMTENELYENEISHIKKRSKKADFDELRFLYTNTDMYRPFGGTEKLKRAPMFSALQKDNFKYCLKDANDILDVNYTSLFAHYAAMICNHRSENFKKAAFHKYVLDGLMESIDQSGDGMSRKTAYVTISPAEMEAFLDLKQLSFRKKMTDKTRNNIYNIFPVTDQSGRQFEVIFDVTIQMSKGF